MQNMNDEFYFRIHVNVTYTNYDIKPNLQKLEHK